MKKGSLYPCSKCGSRKFRVTSMSESIVSYTCENCGRSNMTGRERLNDAYMAEIPGYLDALADYNARTPRPGNRVWR